jgi:hypothetical protein
VQSLPVAAPAAGAEWSAKVPAGEIWRVLSVRALLTTSAVVANRVPALVVADASRTLLTLGAGVNQAAGLAQLYQWAKRLGATLTGQPAVSIANALPELVIPEGGSIGSLTAALDAGDQYSGVVLELEQWSLTDVEQAAAWFARRSSTVV